MISSMSVILVILSSLGMSLAVTSTCELEELRRMKEVFTNCTKKYKAEYKQGLMDNTGSVLSITCKLIDNLVGVCGAEWLECHGEEEVRRMKEMQVEYLIVKNRGADQVDIEQCTTVQQFRNHDTMYDDLKDCTEEETVKSQEEFQSCTHTITYSVNEKMSNLHTVKSV